MPPSTIFSVSPQDVTVLAFIVCVVDAAEVILTPVIFILPASSITILEAPHCSVILVPAVIVIVSPTVNLSCPNGGGIIAANLGFFITLEGIFLISAHLQCLVSPNSLFFVSRQPHIPDPDLSWFSVFRISVTDHLLLPSFVVLLSHQWCDLESHQCVVSQWQ